ncbi:UDP-N-acetylmuramoyl-tripeptide--D-alanyl-D-alanine ligase [Corticibacter populi]|uniref:UDP-N-acetylmuramoyl-tripeptide--D-alanyl-D-alanine ligase n=1 Tax=Corticibacter populi TaxID=1550736 RepID=A0A3M6QP57_9BURK|nr:UDP-N-acetylmuramoyl-tripeptide--D-alanyl-D-alanine ligase [Corticibacter populi]RMX04309.1 UDP-N-acetylmuramoyl-tripeptide--D-alanyl-D-alanine ligase [Corticibacter populi]
MMTLAQAHAWIVRELPGAQLRLPPGVDAAAVPVARVHTDSRSLQPGDLFVALVGERFDAHDFLTQARAAGAAAAIVQAGRAPAELPCIEVADTLEGLGALARQWRRQFDMPVIAVTGSNGKTTVTQMLASILRAAYGDAAMATIGNLNNAIGVPLMALRLRAGQRAAVLELGMNHSGEIAELAAIAQPTVALVNNAQREHLEFMGSVEAVARENGSVLQSLPAGGVAVFPGDDAFAPLWRELAAGRRRIEFGANDSPVALAKARWSEAGWQITVRTPVGQLEAALQVLGRHNLRNALAAVACALAAGIAPEAIVRGLADFRPVKGRSAWHVLRHDDGTSQVLIDDSYNANPDSVRAAIEVLAELPAPRLLVLGDMGEVGEQGAQFHAEAGEYAKAKGVDGLLTVGELARHAAQAFGSGARHLPDMAALLQALDVQAPLAASTLVKGSRFMGMERAVAHVLEADGHASGRVVA